MKVKKHEHNKETWKVTSQLFMKGICNCDSAQIGDINRHIKTVHEEQRYCKCEPCDTKFANKGT